MKLIEGGVYSSKKYESMCIIYIEERINVFVACQMMRLKESQFSLNLIQKKLNNCYDQYFDNLSIITRKDEKELEDMVDGYIGKLDDELYQKIKKRIL